jgi:hypothetical protein
MGYKLTPLENRGHMARVAMDFLKYHLGLPSPTPLGRGGGVACGRLLPLQTPHAVHLSLEICVLQIE